MTLGEIVAQSHFRAMAGKRGNEVPELPAGIEKPRAWQVSLYGDIVIFDEHIFIFEYLDMFNVF